MKRCYVLAALLGCVPYAFLALWGDAERGTLGLYALFLLALFLQLIAWRAIGRKRR